MITGIDKNETFEYVSPLDTDKDNPTVFVLGCISSRKRMSAVMKIESGDQISGMCEIVRDGVVKIKGLKVKGESRDICPITDETIDMLPIVVIKDLFIKILSVNSLTDDEAKN